MKPTLNPKPKPFKAILADKGGTLYTANGLYQESYPPGVYRMRRVRFEDSVVPGLQPQEVSNDEAVEIDDATEAFISEFRDFFKRQENFKKLGFSHKRGYLLHGPPGCGKSSLLRLLEKRFVEEFAGVVLFWEAGANLDFYVTHIQEMTKNRPILVVCEDIDSLMHNFQEEILEFLDGQKGLNNFVLIATTNNLDKIPSRIKDRPSRIDRIVEVGLPNSKVRARYLMSILKDEKKAKKLAAETIGLSIAQIKEIVVATEALGQSATEVIARMRSLVKAPPAPKSEEGGPMLAKLLSRDPDEPPQDEEEYD